MDAPRRAKCEESTAQMNVMHRPGKSGLRRLDADQRLPSSTGQTISFSKCIGIGSHLAHVARFQQARYLSPEYVMGGSLNTAFEISLYSIAC